VTLKHSKMEQPEPNKASIRGKDLVGGIKVMPMGLDAAIKKRTSGEFKSEQRGGALNFSHANQESKMESFKEESSGFNQVSSMKSSAMQSSSMQSSSFQSSSSSSKQMASSKQMSSSSHMTASNEMSSSAMSMSSQKSMSSMTSSKSVSSETKSMSFQSSDVSKQDAEQICDVVTKPLIHNQEIEQEVLKTQIVSAITDLEGDRDFVDFGRDNKPIDLTSPPMTYSPTPKSTFTPTKQDPFSPSKQDVFSPPPLEPMEPPKPQVVVTPSKPAEFAPPTRNGIQNGFSEFTSSSKGTDSGLYSLRRPRQFKGRSDRPISMPVDLGSFGESVPLDLPDLGSMPVKQPDPLPDITDHEELEMNLEVQTIQESSQTQSFQMNGAHEESGSIQGSSSSSSLLQKIMTPAPVEYDTGSLKRRDPRKMFTDSSFYNAAHHPTVADQVEMAHRLSSAMFNDKNSSSKGQKMYLTRVQNSGGMHDDDYQSRHDSVPNMKLVMNPEGKVHEWDDLPEDQKPDYQQIAVHAAPNIPLPDVADPVAESLNAGIGKGEPSLSRPNTFVSAYRRVFDQHRGVFGTQGNTKTPESPKMSTKHTHATPKETKSTKVVAKEIIANKNNNNKSVANKSCENLSKGTKDIVSMGHNKNLDTTKGTSYQFRKYPESPKAPPRKPTHFMEHRACKPSEPLDNKKEVTVKRHKSVNDENRVVLDNRRPTFAVDNYPNLNSIRPSDVLKTPYLLPTNTNQNVGNFPQITSTSMVAKTKAMFEEKDSNSNFVPLGKSRTFSTFPTGNDNDVVGCPLTPSVPQRNSSRKVFATYKSMNANMNHCGTESGSNSPMMERRIPMRNFF